MTDPYSRANEASERKKKLLSFGPNARAVLALTDHGYFVVDPEDSVVTESLLNHGVFADTEMSIFKSLISSNSRVLIVGAHIGSHTVRISKICKSIIAIEANPNTYSLLTMNLKLNDCNNVTPIQIAASDTVGQINFLMNRENSGGSKREPIGARMQSSYYYDDPCTIKINAIPLDDIINISDVDIVIMDIEGSEYFALKGMQKMLHAASVLAVEFLPWHLATIANVSVDEFLVQIFPHFQWMYDMKYNECWFSSVAISRRLQAIYDANEGHDLIFFLKELNGAWLRSIGARVRSSSE